MEIIAHEKADHEVFCVRDQNRMGVLIMDGRTLVHGEAAGCFDETEIRSFIEEARMWLASNGYIRDRKSGEYAAFGHFVATVPRKSATG